MYDTEILQLVSNTLNVSKHANANDVPTTQSKALSPASDLEYKNELLKPHLASQIKNLYEDRTRALINNIQMMFDHSKVTRVPNFLEIQAGDLILFAPKNFEMDKLGGYAIYQYQKEFYPKQRHACYTHAAVSLGGWELYESVTKQGVRRGTLFPYLEEGCEILVRRLDTPETRDWFNRVQVAINAAEMVGQDYSLQAILTTVSDFVKLKLGRARSELSTRDQAISENSVICSQLFVKACERLNINLNPGLPEEYRTVFTPAALSALSGVLKDVDIEWLELDTYLIRGSS